MVIIIIKIKVMYYKLFSFFYLTYSISEIYFDSAFALYPEFGKWYIPNKLLLFQVKGTPIRKKRKYKALTSGNCPHVNLLGSLSNGSGNLRAETSLSMTLLRMPRAKNRRDILQSITEVHITGVLYSLPCANKHLHKDIPYNVLSILNKHQPTFIH